MGIPKTNDQELLKKYVADRVHVFFAPLRDKYRFEYRLTSGGQWREHLADKSLTIRDLSIILNIDKSYELHPTDMRKLALADRDDISLRININAIEE